MIILNEDTLTYDQFCRACEDADLDIEYNEDSDGSLVFDYATIFTLEQLISLLKSLEKISGQ